MFWQDRWDDPDIRAAWQDGYDHGREAQDDKPTPGACSDPECPVLHADPANPVHPPQR